MNQIQNPIFKLLKKILKINKNSLIIESNYVRDSKTKNKVFYDKKNNVFFLQKSIYQKENNYKKLFKDNIKKKIFNLKIKNKKYKFKIIDDETRRYNQFKKTIKNKSIIDFGSGYGDFISKFKKNKIAAIEKRADCINHLKKRKIETYDNLSDIKKKYDVVTFFNSLDHLESPELILKEIKKIINKNGKIIIEVPNANNLLFTLDVKEYKNFTFCKKHLIIHSEETLKKLLIFCGYKIEKIIYFQRYDLNNHLNWLLNKKPGGHIILKNLANEKTNKNYKRLLIEKKLADTLIIIAKLND